MRQGNDRGTQYRSAIYATADQLPLAKASVERYQPMLTAAGYGDITTEIRPIEDAPVLLRRGLPPAVPGQEPDGLLRHRRHGCLLPYRGHRHRLTFGDAARTGVSGRRW